LSKFKRGRETETVTAKDVGTLPPEVVPPSPTPPEGGVTENPPPAALPVGLQELIEEDPIPEEVLEPLTKEETLGDQWERQVSEDGTEQWINRRDFSVAGGVVPQGVIRSLDEAYALEIQRRE